VDPPTRMKRLHLFSQLFVRGVVSKAAKDPAQPTEAATFVIGPKNGTRLSSARLLKGRACSSLPGQRRS